MRFASLAVAVAALAGCHAASPVAECADSSARSIDLFSDMGHHHRTITTRSPEAQRYFDQGLTFTYAFDHDAAIRSYREAAQLDPTAAMPWWGVALANGPHINNPSV